jgi:hypothetical protein
VQVALIVEEVLEEAVCLGRGLDIVLLSVEFGHRKSGVVDPLVPSAETLVTKLDDRVLGELFRLEEHTEFGVGLSHLIAKDTLDFVTIVFTN